MLSASTRQLLSSAKWIGSALFVMAALASAPETAHASTTIAVDLDYDVPINADHVKSGGGFGIRIGQELHLPLIVVNPEVGFTYASFDDPGPSTYRGIVGLRAGIGELLRFGLTAHVGYGYANYPADVNIPGIVNISADHGGFTFDGGLFLDFTALPLLNVGVHAAYNQIAGKDQIDPMRWIQLGAHAALVF
jgi:hypothetical protein